MAQPLELSRPADRPDRLMAISGNRKQPCIAEYSADGGRTWKPATMYTGRTVDDWRTCGYEIWNHGVREGLMPPGNQPCVWNYFFDLAMPANRVALRLKSADDGSVVWEQAVDLGDTGDVFVVDCRNAARLAGGKLPAPWQIKPGTTPLPVESINCEPDVSAPPLVLDPQIKGWYRIYVGMEPCSAFLLYLSGEDIRYSIPDYQGESGPEDRLCREFYIKISETMHAHNAEFVANSDIPFVDIGMYEWDTGQSEESDRALAADFGGRTFHKHMFCPMFAWRTWEPERLEASGRSLVENFADKPGFITRWPVHFYDALNEHVMNDFLVPFVKKRAEALGRQAEDE